MAKVECPSCDVEFELGKCFVGERFDCDECGIELEVMSIRPPEVSWAHRYKDQDDDWDDDDYDDDEDYEEVDDKAKRVPS
jgi:lysine biosynthesis protein LysW